MAAVATAGLVALRAPESGLVAEAGMYDFSVGPGPCRTVCRGPHVGARPLVAHRTISVDLVLGVAVDAVVLAKPDLALDEARGLGHIAVAGAAFDLSVRVSLVREAQVTTQCGQALPLWRTIFSDKGRDRTLVRLAFVDVLVTQHATLELGHACSGLLVDALVAIATVEHLLLDMSLVRESRLPLTPSLRHGDAGRTSAEHECHEQSDPPALAQCRPRCT
jgi:hypothetical protein